MADFGAIRALAFDLDGTLVDSAPGLAAAIDLALAEMGLPQAGEARVGTWIGNGADVLVQRALRWAEVDATPEHCLQLRERFDHFYAQTVDSGSRLFPQVKETLARLATQGYPMALVTNKPTPFVAPLLTSLGIIDYFSLIIGGDDVVEKKPHPAPLYLVLGKLGVRANELLFVGDSRNDIQAAQGAGCPSAALTYGYNYGEEIALSHPDRVLERFADLLPALGLSSLENQEI
ncbi:Phosphoglycolate phosphatase [Serratia grimesii]|jgi:phosphoglycolate phosphatase|uniref:Phosphoglycolate phosphatase n=1 Tax=Serratia grimesii TaxID=82995 RepID=A0ABR4U3U4_9GAMM|nr:phosphoglycolate phosphatase [Serratia grimesii]KFB86530.1 phosphoglycolate phosphatase [Serratia grimesii]CAI1126842.1 Phosphoglycolate phosphatase [Serratia grimesii]CAI1178405.1 Phosphoglycolate phosphatase [Serratia grimesii]CAI1189649.1 Phosphoglycolate phosphatase [Serratia grimesii]CAI1925921.1 Phosphoglycolate phosphatase [Serratia grimesii]